MVVTIVLQTSLLYLIVDKVADFMFYFWQLEKPSTGYLQLLLQCCFFCPALAVGCYILVILMPPLRIYFSLVLRYWDDAMVLEVLENSVVSFLARFTRGSGYLLAFILVLWGIKKLLTLGEERVPQLKEVTCLFSKQGCFAVLNFILALLYYWMR